MVDLRPVIIGAALAGVVLDVDPVAVGVVLALEPVDALRAIDAPDVVSVAVTHTDVSIRPVAVGVPLAIDRTAHQVVVPDEAAPAVAAVEVGVGAIAVGVDCAVKSAVQASLVPFEVLLADARRGVDAIAGAVRVERTIHEPFACHCGFIPLVALVTVAHVDVGLEVGAIAIGVLRAVEVAVLLCPDVLRHAHARARVGVLLGAPLDLGAIEVAQHLVLVPGEFGFAEAGISAVVALLAVGVQFAVDHTVEVVCIPHVTWDALTTLWALGFSCATRILRAVNYTFFVGGVPHKDGLTLAGNVAAALGGAVRHSRAIDTLLVHKYLGLEGRSEEVPAVAEAYVGCLF